MLRILEPTLGVALMLLVLIDVFLTVLYARMGTGIMSAYLARFMWKAYRVGSKPFGRHRSVVLSLCGPSILVALVALWATMLTVGAALIMHQHLGTGVRSQSGHTGHDFVTAMYAAGSSLSIVHISDYAPATGAFRLMYLFDALVGMSTLTLTLTYFLQVYSGLQRRNTLGLKVHLLAAETIDAAELVAGLGPEGRFDAGYANLAEMAGEIADTKEAHHLYPVLFYFRFREPYYSVSRFVLLTMDAVTLVKSALDDQAYRWFKESAALSQLWRAGIMLVRTLEETFLGHDTPESPEAPKPEVADRWRRRYYAARGRLQQAGIKLLPDDRNGAETYVRLRSEWDRHIMALAPAMAYGIEEIDPIGTRPEKTEERPAFRERLRSVI